MLALVGRCMYYAFFQCCWKLMTPLGFWHFFLFFVSKVVAGISSLVMHYVWVIVLYVRLQFCFCFLKLTIK